MNVRSTTTRPLAATAAVLVLLLPLSLKSLRSETPESDQTSPSPDKRWEYRPDESGPKIVKAGTTEVALDLSDQPGGNGFRFATVIWAPDSKRFAFNYGQGREHATSLYQLRDDHWVALKSPSDVDEISNLPEGVVKAQVKKAGISKKVTYLRELQWTLKVRQWIDPNTAILYASLRERAERGSDLDREDLGYFGADFLFTLKFDDNGNWKIVKTHRMSSKGEESQSTSVPLAEEVAYQSPKDSYRIQASADGTALWIVPTNDPARRKVLPDADPYQQWNKAREDAVKIYLPFAPKLEQENLRLQFLCDLTEEEVKQLEEFVAPAARGSEAPERPAPAPTSTL